MEISRIPTFLSGAGYPNITPAGGQGGAAIDRVDLGSSSGAASKPYIVIPPAGKEGEGLFKASKIQLADMGVKVKGELPLIGGYTASLDDSTVKKLQKQGFTVFLDQQDTFLPPKPWEKAVEEDLGTAGKPKKAEKIEPFEPRPELTGPRFSTPLTEKFQGEGVTIAVLDTGIYPHPDFMYPEPRIVGWVDMVNGRTIPYDDNGHGTHVAGDAAGSGLQSGGVFRGSAPKANLVGVKVLSGEGSGKTSDIIKGLDWVLKNKDKMNIRVVNMSLGHDAQKKWQDDPIDQAVGKLIEAGIVVVAAAGNDGPERRTIKAPGDHPQVITVGAVDDRNTPDPKDDKVTPFSSRGPTPAGLPKPDLVAPGEAIFAPNSPGTGSEAQAQRFGVVHQTVKWLSEMHANELERVPDQQFALMGLAPETIAKLKEGGDVAKNEFNRLLHATSRMPLVATSYIGMPGTSMATPIVAGVVAQMLEANPDLTPEQVKEILTKTADPLPRVGKNTQGAGMVDPDEAISQALYKALAGKLADDPALIDVDKLKDAKPAKEAEPAKDAAPAPAEPPAPVPEEKPAG